MWSPNLLFMIRKAVCVCLMQFAACRCFLSFSDTFLDASTWVDMIVSLDPSFSRLGCPFSFLSVVFLHIGLLGIGHLDFVEGFWRKKYAHRCCALCFFFALYDYAFGGNNPLGWIDYGFGGYWFTIVLFQMFVVYLLLNVISRIIKHTIVNITMVAIAVLCLYILIFDRPNETNRVWVMLCGENLTKYFQFFVLGIFARKYFMAFGRLLSNDSFRVAMVVGFVICMCLWYSDTLKQYDLVYRFIHDILIRYFGVMMVVSVVFAYKDYFENQHFIPQTFRLMGRRSLDIYIYIYIYDSLFLLAGFTMVYGMAVQ